MSNVQTDQRPPLFVPALITTSTSDDQEKTARSFLIETMGWQSPLPAAQVRWLNQAQENIAIETIRELIAELSYAPHLGQLRAFVLLAADKLSLPAQHALLKSLEEPPTQTQLLLITAYPDTLLSTIKSRCLIYHHRDELAQAQLELPINIKQFLAQPPNTSYSQLIKLADEYKDRTAAVNLINQLLQHFHSNQNAESVTQKIAIETQLLQTLQALNHNANVKLALEHALFNIKDTLST